MSIYKPVIGVDSMGGDSTVWSLIDSVPCRIEELKRNRFESLGRDNTEATHRIYCMPTVLTSLSLDSVISIKNRSNDNYKTYEIINYENLSPIISNSRVRHIELYVKFMEQGIEYGEVDESSSSSEEYSSSSSSSSFSSWSNEETICLSGFGSELVNGEYDLFDIISGEPAFEKTQGGDFKFLIYYNEINGDGETLYNVWVILGSGFNFPLYINYASSPFTDSWEVYSGTSPAGVIVNEACQSDSSSSSGSYGDI